MTNRARAGYDVFISYASADLKLAEEVHRLLSAAGLSVWFDKARLKPGYEWHKEIEAGSESSRVLLPLLTPRWKQSDWTKFETYGAEAVIPLIVEGSFAETSTPPLTRFQGLAIDFSQRIEQSSHCLIASIRELLAQTAPEKQTRLANVRYHANRFFVGREKELLQIHEELHQHPTAVLTQGQVRAVTALGGVGKTTLARQYVEKFWRCYPQLLWIDSRLGLETEFARLCDLLVPSQTANTNVGEKARRALRVLEERAERLLVIDNAEDEKSIQAWIPKTGGCRTLITSRYASWSAAITPIRLNVLEPDPSRVLLVKRSGIGEFSELSSVERSACDELAKQLGYLPLALEQAAAYIEQQGAGFGFVDYLRLYDETARELLAAGVMGSTEYPDSVLTTWTATTAKLSPGSRAILRLSSFLAPTPLPLTALLGGFEWLTTEAADVAGATLHTPAHAEFWVREQVRQLRAYSMVEGDATSILLHPLVQKVEQLHLDRATGQYRRTLDRALQWIGTTFVGDPEDVRSWSVLEPLALHAQMVAERADQEGISEPTAQIESMLGSVLHAKAQFAEAEPLIRRALAIGERLYGAEHPNIATCLNNLAVLLQATNRLAEAEPLIRRALAIDKLSYGTEHPNFARDLSTLAAVLRATNRFAEAEPLMRRALAISERSFGAVHPDVGTHLNNLAQLLQETNRLAEAEPMIARVVSIFEQTLGDNHPKVATALNNLAHLFQATNRLSAAEPLIRRALAIDEHSYGAEHPNVATVINNLGQLLQATNRLSEAEALLRRALAIDVRSYGVEHPEVATSLNNLALLLTATYRLAEAEPLLRRALAIDEQSYGAVHPSVAIRLNNLAGLLQVTDRLAEAEPLIRRALAINEQSYGAEHPSVARQLNNLAVLLKTTNRLAEAEPLMRRALAIDEQAYGAEHPEVASDLCNLAALLQTMNRVAEAEPLVRRALAIDERSYGAEHPKVARDLDCLAGLLKDTNRLAEAEPLFRRALAIDERSYGAEHPNVARDLNGLAGLLMVASRLTEAEPLIRRALAILYSSLGPEHPDTLTVHRNFQALAREIAADTVHPYLQEQLLKQQQRAAIHSEDYALAAKCRDEIVALQDAGDHRHFDPESLKLLDRVLELNCIALPVKQAIGGRMLLAERQEFDEDVQTALHTVEFGIVLVEDFFADFSDYQFRDLSERLTQIHGRRELFAKLGVVAEARKEGFSLCGDAWSAYAIRFKVDGNSFLYCIANRWAQVPPTKEEAFHVADVFDRLGYPAEASALRSRFSNGEFDPDQEHEL